MASHPQNIISFWVVVLLSVVLVFLHQPSSSVSLESLGTHYTALEPLGVCTQVTEDTCTQFCREKSNYFGKTFCWTWSSGPKVPRAFNCHCAPTPDGRQAMDVKPAVDEYINRKEQEAKSANSLAKRKQVNCTEPYSSNCYSFCNRNPALAVKGCVFNLENNNYADWHQCVCSPK